MDRLRGTYSIVACDPATGEIGCAVQSKYFAVGWVVPWVRAGVGAVATQASAIAAYGQRGLELLAAGHEPRAAIEEILRADEGRETRQLGVVDAAGRVASFTGSECNAWAGHVEGDGYAVQGNILVGEEVVREMASAYEAARGDLAERMMQALEAAQAAGGDSRGQQSAAIVVERAGAASQRREGIDRVCDLRVDDHERPIEELRRLVEMNARQQAVQEAAAHFESRDWEKGIEVSTRALERFGDDAVLLYNRACYASLAGRRGVAIDDLRRAIALDASMVEMAGADSDFAALAEDDEFRRIVAPG